MSLGMTRDRIRADRLLVERGHFESRARAQGAIAAGLVRADGRVVARPSDLIAPGEEGLRDIRVVEAIYKSAASGKTVKI